ncbi:hypothetical protein STAFG_2302 [Streptomyces afghaniensis 772]|uniref:Uncharacterized protein n=1 Tax=Streptomyces afghaniensis 772 TaxID=1283301 RepID=S4MM52_9ACTN|nr:hypothetical protein STAFG_2302 [Streptomyces afghaniensis 772]
MGGCVGGCMSPRFVARTDTSRNVRLRLQKLNTSDDALCLIVMLTIGEGRVLICLVMFEG